ncbi:hypothetical protein [Phaffia rhodozyma]|uniref:Uncharacterized protein n=1 Tax=Phaffia rhodozyma TaxID=264483 RepID=A0A0F7SSF1_PHARH|nr:hypothetical protein [Phaffia rhodozyma]
MGTACWLDGDNPWSSSLDNRGQPCKIYGTVDYIVASVLGGILVVILIALGLGWLIQHSKKASRFRAFWNQSGDEDLEMKTHHHRLINTSEVERHLYDPPMSSAGSVRSGKSKRSSMVPMGVSTASSRKSKTGNTGTANARSPLSGWREGDDITSVPNLYSLGGLNTSTSSLSNRSPSPSSYPEQVKTLLSPAPSSFLSPPSQYSPYAPSTEYEPSVAAYPIGSPYEQRENQPGSVFRYGMTEGSNPAVIPGDIGTRPYSPGLYQSQFDDHYRDDRGYTNHQYRR